MVGRQFKLDVLITAIDRISAPMQRMNARISRLTAPGRKVMNAFSSVGQAAGVSQLTERFAALAAAVGKVGAAAVKSGKRLVGVVAAGAGLAYLFKRQFVDTASTFENLDISLESIEGSAKGARKAMSFIKDLTIKTPFELPDIASSFRLMRAQGMDPMNGSLQNIVSQVAKVGGGGDKLLSVAMQLSQAWSKGRLMAQDANILAENGIPVWAMLARAVERTTKGQKVSVAQLRKMSEGGQLGLKAISLLIEQMGLESQGALQRAMTSLTGIVSNISDAWTFFKKRVMDAGPFDRIKQMLGGILDRINAMDANGELQAWANRFATTLETAFTWLQVNGPRILSQIWNNLQRIFSAADTIATAFGGWGNLITFGLAAYIGGPLVASVFSLLAAIVSLNGALLGTPAGWLLAGGGLAILGGVAAWKSLKWPGAGAATRTDGNGMPLLDARTVAQSVAAPAPTADAPAASRGFAYLNPFKRLPADEQAAVAAAAGASRPALGAPLNVKPPKLQLGAADQAAIAAAMAGRDSGGSVSVDVQFGNVPQGTKIRTQQTGNLDFSRGVSMAHAY